MSQISVAAQLSYAVNSPTALVFSVLPAITNRQRIVDDNLLLDPSGRVEELADGQRRLVRVFVDHDLSFSLNYAATVEVEPRRSDPGDLDQTAVDHLPVDVLDDLAPSRYCESDRLGRFAQNTFSDAAPGYERVQRVSDWVNEQLEYVPGVSDGTTTALDTLIERAGVCRDFAHLSIALCRALGIPARYVAGYGVGVEPQDFHGFFEAFVGDAWYMFDPTGMTPNDGLVRISHGRDAGDTPFATVYGDAELTLKNVAVTPLSIDADGEPVSTA